MTATLSAMAVAPSRMGWGHGPVFVYARISRDRAGTSLGTSRQISDAITYATDKEIGDGTDPEDWCQLCGSTHVFKDNDTSGYSGKPRPGYDALRVAMRNHAGTGAVVVAWHLDRLTRQGPGALEAFLADCQQTGTMLRTVTAGELDPTSPDGVLMAEIGASLAKYESAHKSRRVSRKHEELALNGKPHGGRRRFGYEAGMARIRESEAKVVRDVVARLLAGESLHSLAESLNAKGVDTPDAARRRAKGLEPAKWTGSNLGTLLKRPHLAGIRVHKGQQHPGEWPAIIDRATHEQVLLVLGDPTRRTSYTNARKYLLAGLATCYTCGAPLRGRPGTVKNPERRAYACATGRHCYRAVEDVDAIVEARIVRRLERMTEAGKLVLDGHGHADDAEALERAKTALADRRKVIAGQFARGEIGPDTLADTTAALDTEAGNLDKRIAELRLTTERPLAVLEGMTGRRAARAWKQADLGRKRAVIDVLCTIRLKGAVNRRSALEVRDVVMDWHQFPGALSVSHDG